MICFFVGAILLLQHIHIYSAAREMFPEQKEQKLLVQQQLNIQNFATHVIFMFFDLVEADPKSACSEVRVNNFIKIIQQEAGPVLVSKKWLALNIKENEEVLSSFKKIWNSKGWIVRDIDGLYLLIPRSINKLLEKYEDPERPKLVLGDIDFYLGLKVSTNQGIDPAHLLSAIPEKIDSSKSFLTAFGGREVVRQQQHIRPSKIFISSSEYRNRNIPIPQWIVYRSDSAPWKDKEAAFDKFLNTEIFTRLLISSFCYQASERETEKAIVQYLGASHDNSFIKVAETFADVETSSFNREPDFRLQGFMKPVKDIKFSKLGSLFAFGLQGIDVITFPGAQPFTVSEIDKKVFILDVEKIQEYNQRHRAMASCGGTSLDIAENYKILVFDGHYIDFPIFIESDDEFDFFILFEPSREPLDFYIKQIRLINISVDSLLTSFFNNTKSSTPWRMWIDTIKSKKMSTIAENILKALSHQKAVEEDIKFKLSDTDLCTTMMRNILIDSDPIGRSGFKFLTRFKFLDSMPETWVLADSLNKVQKATAEQAFYEKQKRVVQQNAFQQQQISVLQREQEEKKKGESAPRNEPKERAEEKKTREAPAKERKSLCDILKKNSADQYVIKPSERFEKWLETLNDKEYKDVIFELINAKAAGHFRDEHDLASSDTTLRGVWEAKFRVVRGIKRALRIYFIRPAEKEIYLILGGDKGTQEGGIDIPIVKAFLKETAENKRAQARELTKQQRQSQKARQRGA